MRIRQTQDFLSDIMRRVQTGHLVPAAFQRPYVWGPEDVTALWTSLLAGWPIGSFLIWEPDETTDIARATRLRLGPIPTARQTRWSGMILDGQQRLTTLAWSLLAHDAPRPDLATLFPMEHATWAGDQVLVADGETRSVRWLPASEAGIGWRIPAGALADLELMFRAIHIIVARDHGELQKDVLDWFDSASHAVRSARITITTIENATVQEAVTAFAHVARVGVPVTPDEVAAALAWAAS